MHFSSMMTVSKNMDHNDLATFINNYIPLLEEIRSVCDIKVTDVLFSEKLKDHSTEELREVMQTMLEKMSSVDLERIYRRYFRD